MTLRFASPPPFGQADLSNCEREQIHLAGSIQPHGALLVVRESDFVVTQASANASAFLNLDGEMLGRSLHELDGDLLKRIEPNLSDARARSRSRCAAGSAARPRNSTGCCIARPTPGW